MFTQMQHTCHGMPVLQGRPGLQHCVPVKGQSKVANTLSAARSQSGHRCRRVHAKASADDQMRKMQQEMMNNPQMMQMMQSQEFQQAMMSLQSDPELAPLFQQAQSGGPAGVMSMAQNPKVMRKLSEKLGPLYQKAGMGGAAAPQAPPTQEEEQLIKMQQQAMQDPQFQQLMSSPNFQQAMQDLENDPEIGPALREAQSKGPSGAMGLMNNRGLMEKLQSKLMSAMPADAQPASSAPAAAAGPEINNLFEAAKHGDVEATEDFIAIGKDVNMVDADQRTPLHYAVAYAQHEVFDELVKAGAKLNVVDNKGNSPLHYAAGYGRPSLVQPLLQQGSDGKLKNATGHTPYGLLALDPKNAIHSQPDIVQLLQKAQ